MASASVLFSVGGEDEVFIFLRSVALVAADAAVCHEAFGLAVPGESFKSPVAGGGELFFYL